MAQPGILKRLSDGFVPRWIGDRLDRVVLFRVAKHPVNGWFFVHALSGVAMRVLGLGPRAANYVHAGWELFQAVIGDNPPTQETLFDIPIDTIAMNIGYHI